MDKKIIHLVANFVAIGKMEGWIYELEYGSTKICLDFKKMEIMAVPEGRDTSGYELVLDVPEFTSKDLERMTFELTAYLIMKIYDYLESKKIKKVKTKAGKARWSGVDKEERSRRMSELSKKRWAKVDKLKR